MPLRHAAALESAKIRYLMPREMPLPFMRILLFYRRA